MQIDWLTVGAQIANFLILVALLQRFLYRPVLDAMDRREAGIAQALRAADQRESEADARARAFEEQSADLERRRQAILEEVRDAAEMERRERLAEARADVEHQRERWHAQLAQEWDDLRKSLARRLAGAVVEATRRAMADLGDTTLDEAMTRAFQHRLATLSADDRRAFTDGAGPVEIATSFEPNEAVRRTLAAAVREHLGRDVQIVRVEGLVAGIELRTRGWKMSWTVAEYLRDVEDGLGETIAAAAHHVER